MIVETTGRNRAVLTIALFLLIGTGACGTSTQLATSSPSASIDAPSPSASAAATTSPTAPLPTTQPTSTAPTSSPCAPVSSPPPQANWQTYSDATYSFSISYPAGFTLEPQHGVPGTAIVMLYRAVDTCYLGGYPPGQVEFGVYAR